MPERPEIEHFGNCDVCGALVDMRDLALCLPQIMPEPIGDAVHPGLDGTECAPLPQRHVISARPCNDK